MKTERFLKAILEMFCSSRFGTAIWCEQTFVLEQNYIRKYFFNLFGTSIGWFESNYHEHNETQQVLCEENEFSSF